MKTTPLAAASLAALALSACQPADWTAAEFVPSATDLTADTATVTAAPAGSAPSPASQPSSSNGSSGGMTPDGAVNANSPPPIVAPDPEKSPPT